MTAGQNPCIKGKKKKKESIIAKLPLVAVQHSMENCDWSLVIPLYIKAPKSYLVCHESLCCVLCVRKNSHCIKSAHHSHVVLHKGQQDVLLHWLFFLRSKWCGGFCRSLPKNVQYSTLPKVREKQLFIYRQCKSEASSGPRNVSIAGQWGGGKAGTVLGRAVQQRGQWPHPCPPCRSAPGWRKCWSASNLQWTGGDIWLQKTIQLLEIYEKTAFFSLDLRHQ